MRENEAVRLERRGAVLIVTIDRPARRNAVDGPTAAALADAFRDFDVDPSLSVAILTGAGGTFCAGADLQALADGGATNRVEEDGDGPMGPTRMRLGKPVIAAIAGHAVAGGLELALWCDLRVIERDATLGVFCRRWGVPLIDGGTVRLPRLIGLSRALDLILTGRPVDAEEALRIGLCHRICDPGAAVPTALALAEQLAAFPPLALRGDRDSALASMDMDFDAAMAHEFRAGMPALRAEARAGATRFRDGAGRHGSFEQDAEGSEGR
ncbi:MAG: crotonase/enoyl-CoA hydratase family protein [Deltaproteobacteria bacterium]|nr:crotonase/enoyl-CoA hydratase family protein [Deltaproteobacteria bacterium]